MGAILPVTFSSNDDRPFYSCGENAIVVSDSVALASSIRWKSNHTLLHCIDSRLRPAAVRSLARRTSAFLPVFGEWELKRRLNRFVLFFQPVLFPLFVCFSPASGSHKSLLARCLCALCGSPGTLYSCFAD